MQQMQEGHMKDAPEGTSVRWFQINEKTITGLQEMLLID